MNDMEKFLLGAERPQPREDMRTRVLAAALPLVQSQDSRLDRVWFSFKWRMLAVFTCLVLAAVDVVSVHINAWAPVGQDAVVSDTVQAVEMAAREAGLTPAETSALVAQAIAATRPPSSAALNIDNPFQRSYR